jgi:hypothetical protein
MFRSLKVPLLAVFAGIALAALPLTSHAQSCSAQQSTDCNGNCCGPGNWQAGTPSNKGNDTPTAGPPNTWTNLFGVVFGSGSDTTGGSTDKTSTCTSSASGNGTFSWALNSASFSQTSNDVDNFNYSLAYNWSSCSTTCARNINIAATGGGDESVNATCAAEAGSSAIATCSGSGTCSAHNVSATLTMHGLSCLAQFASGTQAASGNIGGQKTDNSANVTGSYSSNFSTTGTGSAAGSASYSLAPGLKDVECTADAITVTQTGNTAANGNGTVEDNGGSMSYSATSDVTMSISGP